MHAPPAFQLSVHRFGVWRCALGLMTLLVLGTIASWVLISAPAGPQWVGWLLLGCLLPLWRAPRVSAFSLRWDSQCWHLGPLASRGREPVSGQVQVALDLGSWMLLRLQPDGQGRFPGRVHWLPLQRRGHENAWHALRCTVHSARTDAAGPGTAP